MSTRPENLGLTNGKLAKCPRSPNCVSTFAKETDEKHYISPLSFKGSVKDTMDKVKEVLDTMSRTKIITETENYIHAECTTLIFRFVDDLEIYLEESTKLIHFRSASRVGHSDFGVNRKRVNKLKSKLDGV